MFGLNAWIGVALGVVVAALAAAVDRLFLRAHQRHPVPHADARLLAARLLGRAEMARRHRRVGRHRHSATSRASSASTCRNRCPCYFMALVFLRAAIAALRRLVNSPLGLVFVGIRENEARMRAIGYPTRAYKLAAFTIGGAFAGFAGGLYAIFNGFISPDAVYWSASGDILIMAMLGGAGTLIGPVIGAGAFLLMKNVVSSYSEHWLSIIGVDLRRLRDVTSRAASGARCSRCEVGARA